MAKEMTDHKVALIAQDGSRPCDGQQSHDVKAAVVGKEARGEQQRVAGKEREEHHARLDKDNQEHTAVGISGPAAIQLAIAVRGSLSSSAIKLMKPMKLNLSVVGADTSKLTSIRLRRGHAHDRTKVRLHYQQVCIIDTCHAKPSKIALPNP